MAFISGLISAAPYIIAGAQAASQIGAAHYGGKRIDRQREENKRAEARAAMISSLTGARAMSQPEVYEMSAAEKGFGALGSFASIGSSLLPFMKTPKTTTTTIPRPKPTDLSGPLSGQGYTNPRIPIS